MVRVTGFEPARGYHQNLNLARLPIPPYPQGISLMADLFIIMHRLGNCKRNLFGSGTLYMPKISHWKKLSERTRARRSSARPCFWGTDFRFLRFGLCRQAKADGKGLVYPVHGAGIQAAHFFFEAVLIDGAHLLQKHYGIL